MVDLEEIMLQEEVEKNVEGIDIKDKNIKEKNKDGDVEDDIEMSKKV